MHIIWKSNANLLGSLYHKPNMFGMDIVSHDVFYAAVAL
jgi:hypothetical protein